MFILKCYNFVHRAVALFAKENFLPRSYNKADAEKVLQIAEGIHVSTMGVGMKESQKRLVKLLSYTTRGQTSSVVSLIGGVVAQEVTSVPIKLTIN